MASVSKRHDRVGFLDRAMRAFWAHGYEGTSMQHLVDATGVQRGSIYAAYEGKRALFLAALRHYDLHYRDAFLRRAALRRRPRESILAAFAMAAAGDGSDGVPGGCLLVNSAVQMAPDDAELAQIVLGSLGHVEDFFFDRVRQAQADGTVSARADASALAKALLGLFVGLRVVARCKAGQATRDAIVGQAGAMLR
jgi:TetR/AcrR family transcriptional repressor of nem operon